MSRLEQSEQAQRVALKRLRGIAQNIEEFPNTFRGKMHELAEALHDIADELGAE
jgi:hypothetical protein